MNFILEQEQIFRTITFEKMASVSPTSCGLLQKSCDSGIVEMLCEVTVLQKFADCILQVPELWIRK
jgi:hypothetical protein